MILPVITKETRKVDTFVISLAHVIRKLQYWPDYPEVFDSVISAIWDKLEVWFVAFSGYSNMKRMFRIRDLDSDLPTLDCVRFLSYSWSVLGYTWVLGPIVSECWLSGMSKHA